MRKFLGVSAAALLVAACGSETEGTFETEDGGSGTYSVDSDGGETSISITGDDGEQLSINSGSNVDVDLPDGYSIYPGANVVTNTSITQDDGVGSMVIMTSSDSPEEILAFYRAQAEAAGIEIKLEMNTGDSSMLAGENEAGDSFSLNASSSEDGTTAQLLVGHLLGD